MAVTPAAGWMLDPADPTGSRVIPIGTAATVNNPNAAIIAGGTSQVASQPYVTPSTFGAVNVAPAPAPAVQTYTTQAVGNLTSAGSDYAPGTYRIPAGYNIPNGTLVEIDGSYYRTSNNVMTRQDNPGPSIATAKNISAYAPQGVSGGTNNDALKQILSNPGLTTDQKAVIQSIYGAVQSNDADTAARIQSAMAAASQFSDPYFKAQVRLVTDALQRGLTGKEGDLAFAEQQQRAALDELRTNTAASKEFLSLEHAQELKNLEAKYTQDLQQTQDNMAASGFTASSRRARAEQILSEQNAGLVESSNRSLAYRTGSLDRDLAATDTRTRAQIANLQRLASEGKLDLLRTAESQAGSGALSSLGYTGLLNNVGGDIARNQAQDALSFSSNFVF